MQGECRCEKAKETAAQEKYFGCMHCLQDFRSQKLLDDHTMRKHTFVCGACYKVFTTKEQRGIHMHKDHKAPPPQKITPQERKLFEEWQKRMARREKDRRAQQEWDDI